jgi:hypothetical protein
LVEKNILLASFLASNNPQESDSTTFGNALKGRRKRLRAGQDPDQVGTGSQSTDQSSVISPRTFGLERLLAIYTQILPSTAFSTLSTLWWNPLAARHQRDLSQWDESTSGPNGGTGETKQRMKSNPMIFEIEQKLLYYGHSESHIFSAVCVLHC